MNPEIVRLKYGSDAVVLTRADASIPLDDLVQQARQSLVPPKEAP